MSKLRIKRIGHFPIQPGLTDILPHAIEGQSWILDSMPLIPYSRYLIPILSRIPDSLSCILDSKAQDTGFHSKNCTDSGIRIPLHGTYNALRVTPPPKLQNQCCCLPHICIAPHLTDKHSVFLKGELFLSLIGLGLDPL